MNTILLTLALGLTACGTGSFGVPSEVRSHYDAFMTDCYLYSKTLAYRCGTNKWKIISISMDDHDTTRAGVCIISIRGLHVKFNPKYWRKYDDNTKKALVYHELSHCILGMDHTPDADGIMSPALSPNATNPMWLKTAISDLFITANRCSTRQWLSFNCH
jgi:hypothetical protein